MFSDKQMTGAHALQSAWELLAAGHVEQDSMFVIFLDAINYIENNFYEDQQQEQLTV